MKVCGESCGVLGSFPWDGSGAGARLRREVCGGSRVFWDVSSSWAVKPAATSLIATGLPKLLASKARLSVGCPPRGRRVRWGPSAHPGIVPDCPSAVLRTCQRLC